MASSFIFCNPADAYSRMSEGDATEAYRLLNIDYDQFSQFSGEYQKWKDIPDVRQIEGAKQGRELELRVFLDQDVERFGRAIGPLTSTNYLFNVVNPGLLCFARPDLDIVYVEGRNARSAAEEIVKFYEKRDWTARLVEQDVPAVIPQIHPVSRLRVLGVNLGRCPKMHDPRSLLEIARKTVGYDPTKLCWRND